MFVESLLLDMFSLGIPLLRGGVRVLIFYKVSFEKHSRPHTLLLPSPSSPDNDFDEFHHTFDANYYKNPPPQSGFDCPDSGGKNPDLAGRPGSGGGDCFHGSKKL